MKKMLTALTLVLICCSIPLAVPGEDKLDQETSVTATLDKDGIQRVEIVGGSYFFRPSHIIVKVNLPVELKVRKESGLIPHNIIIKAPEAGMVFTESLGSDPKTISFTPTRIGSYPFYCGNKLLFFESHQEKGMKGIIEVVE